MCWAKDRKKGEGRRKGSVVSIISFTHIRTKITRNKGGKERKEKKQTNKQENKNEKKITTIIIIIKEEEEKRRRNGIDESILSYLILTCTNTFRGCFFLTTKSLTSPSQPSSGAVNSR